MIPFPGDLLVGAYYPWLENKFGYAVGVPVKNSLISDIFSQFFIWKDFIAKSFANFQWPLWNPFMYSGQPLMANFNSGPLNPINILLQILGSVNGWAWLVILQSAGAALTMYLFLKQTRKETIASIIGSVVYAFGGFSLLWSQFVNAGYAMIWIPLILLVIEKAADDKKGKGLLWLSPLFFLVVVSGHMQSLIYTAVITASYYVYRCGLKNRQKNRLFAVSVILSIGMSAIQLLPTIELMNHSIRFNDGSNKSVNYGLLPLGNLITLLAPDFFGNPSTLNYWGFMNYHETITYTGIIGVVALIYGLFNFKKLKTSKFFFIAALTAMLLQFDTPLGKAVYLFKVPLLWTSAAGRIGLVSLLGIAVLTAEMIDEIKNFRWKEVVKLYLLPVLSVLLAFAITYLSWKAFKDDKVVMWLGYNIQTMRVAMRNLVFPSLLIGAFGLIFLLSKKIKFWKWLVLFVVIADLFRFGWKYLPMVPRNYFYPENPVTDFIRKDNSVFRVDREKGELLPPNTWMAYGIMSPSGYDPMAIIDYVKAYNTDLNGEKNPGIARYSELVKYDPEALGRYNVKYLLAIKRDDKGIVPGNNINYKIDEKDWKRVFETDAVAVLLNPKYKERARIIDSDGEDAKGMAKIVSYGNNKVVIDFTNIDGEKLLLADTYYPGWKATINGKSTKIGDDIKPFRTVDVRGVKEGTVVFEYKPESFRWGLIISGASFIVWLLWNLLGRRRV